MGKFQMPRECFGNPWLSYEECNHIRDMFSNAKVIMTFPNHDLSCLPLNLEIIFLLQTFMCSFQHSQIGFIMNIFSLLGKANESHLHLDSLKQPIKSIQLEYHFSTQQ